MIKKEKKQEIMQAYARTEGDTGSPEVQVAVLTARINELTDGFCILNHLLKHEFNVVLKTKFKAGKKGSIRDFGKAAESSEFRTKFQ